MHSCNYHPSMIWNVFITPPSKIPWSSFWFIPLKGKIFLISVNTDSFCFILRSHISWIMKNAEECILLCPTFIIHPCCVPAVVHSFLLTISILFFHYTSMCSSIVLLMDICLVSSYGLLKLRPLWMSLYKSFFLDMCFHFWG